MRCYQTQRLRRTCRTYSTTGARGCDGPSASSASLSLLTTAWRFPWQAYALFILGAAGFVTFFAPQLPYVAALKQEVVGAICAFVTLLAAIYYPTPQHTRSA